MKLAIVGSRGFDTAEDWKWVYDTLDAIRETRQIDEIVSGGANGVDTIAEHYAADNDIPLRVFPAKWNIYGKRAGYVRNVDIWMYCDEGIAFWDGKSPGTKHSFELAKKYNKHIIVETREK